MYPALLLTDLNLRSGWWVYSKLYQLTKSAK